MTGYQPQSNFPKTTSCFSASKRLTLSARAETPTTTVTATADPDAAFGDQFANKPMPPLSQNYRHALLNRARARTYPGPAVGRPVLYQHRHREVQINLFRSSVISIFHTLTVCPNG